MNQNQKYFIDPHRIACVTAAPIQSQEVTFTCQDLVIKDTDSKSENSLPDVIYYKFGELQGMFRPPKLCLKCRI